MTDSSNAPTVETDAPTALPPLPPPLDPATVPYLSLTNIRPDGSLQKRILQEGTGRLVAPNSKIWLTLEGRKTTGEYFQREVKLTYTIGQKGAKVISQGLLETLLTMRIGEVVWVQLSQDLHIYPIQDAIWLKVTVNHAMETIETKLPSEAGLDEHSALSERLILEGNGALRAKLHKESISAYNKALDCLRSYKTKTDSPDTKNEEQRRISAIQLRCELNISQAFLSFAEGIKDKDLQGKRLQEAMLHASMALRIAEDSVKGWYRKAKACLLLGDLEVAAEAVTEGLRREPGNGEMRLLREKIQAERKEAREKEKRTFRNVLQ